MNSDALEEFANHLAQISATQGQDYLARRDAGVEQAKTWAAEIAALKVENAALRAENTHLKSMRAIPEPPAPPSNVSRETFPPNALRHSR